MSTDYAKYEEDQLRLIAATYEKPGFRVVVERPLEDPEGRLKDFTFRFDAVVYDKKGYPTTIIELIKADKRQRDIDSRRDAFQTVAQAYPDVNVDFRYIDADAEPFWSRREPSQRVSVNLLDMALARRLPRTDERDVHRAAQYADFWTLHVVTIRAYAQWLGIEGHDSKDILDLYNALLRFQRLIPPEATDDNAHQDLFELHRTTLAVLQGGLASYSDIEQIRSHITSVRKQIRKRLKDAQKPKRRL